MELDSRVAPPLAVAVKEIRYFPIVVVSRVIDMHATEVSLKEGHDG